VLDRGGEVAGQGAFSGTARPEHRADHSPTRAFHQYHDLQLRIRRRFGPDPILPKCSTFASVSAMSNRSRRSPPVGAGPGRAFRARLRQRHGRPGDQLFSGGNPDTLTSLRATDHTTWANGDWIPFPR
jgi:hypothetical protein